MKAESGASASLLQACQGTLAEVVLLDASPLENIRNTTRIAAVVTNGVCGIAPPEGRADLSGRRRKLKLVRPL